MPVKSLEEKMSQVQTVLVSQDIDVFIIMEANRVSKDLDRFIFPGYLIFLPEFRRNANGILIGIKNTLISSFEIMCNL